MRCEAHGAAGVVWCIPASKTTTAIWRIAVYVTAMGVLTFLPRGTATVLWWITAAMRTALCAIIVGAVWVAT